MSSFQTMLIDEFVRSSDTGCPHEKYDDILAHLLLERINAKQRR